MANRVYCTAASTRWYEKERKAVPTLLSPTSLTWDAIMSLEPGQAWVPLLNWGGWHSLVGCPWLTLLILFPKFWLGPESRVASRPQGIWRQGSASLNLLWCWGSQLKPCSWECSLLALEPKHPQQRTVVLERLARAGCLCDASGGKITETQALLG